MSNAIHRRLKEIRRATEDISSSPITVELSESTVKVLSGAFQAAIRGELHAAPTGVDPKPPNTLMAELQPLRTQIEQLTCLLHLVELDQIVEAWAPENYKQQNERRRDACGELERWLSSLLPEVLAGEPWAECKKDFEKNMGADAVRARKPHLHDCIQKIRVRLQRM